MSDDVRAVVKVVVPCGVYAIPSVRRSVHGEALLTFVLGDDDDRAIARGLPGRRRDDGDDVLGGCVVDALDGVEPKPVEMELVDPVAGVLRKVLAHRFGVGPVEVQRVAPLVVVFLREVLLCELADAHSPTGPKWL